MEQEQKIWPDVSQSLGAWKTLQEASVSLLVFSKKENAPSFILPTFGDSEAVLVITYPQVAW